MRSRRQGTGPGAASRGKREGAGGLCPPSALSPSLELNLEEACPCPAWHSKHAPETPGGMSGLGVPVLGPGSGAHTVWAVQGPAPLCSG